MPSDQIAEALIEAFPVGSGDVLVVQAETARSDVAGGLRAKGWRVEVVAAYRTVPVRPSAATLIGVLSADAVLFASGSAVAAWAGVFGLKLGWRLAYSYLHPFYLHRCAAYWLAELLYW